MNPSIDCGIISLHIPIWIWTPLSSIQSAIPVVLVANTTNTDLLALRPTCKTSGLIAWLEERIQIGLPVSAGNAHCILMGRLSMPLLMLALVKTLLILVRRVPFVYTRNHDILSGNLQMISDPSSSPSPSFTDGSCVPLSTKRFVTVVGDGKYIIYTSLAWQNTWC